MDCGDQIPVSVLHVLEADIPQDSCVVEQDIDTAKGLNSSLYYGLAILDAVVVGDGASASCLDLVDDDICGLSYMKSAYTSLIPGVQCY
jgi:hypothetical protein